MLTCVILQLNQNTKITTLFDKSLTVGELVQDICELCGIEDSSYFGLFIQSKIGKNDFWLDNRQSLEDQIVHSDNSIPLFFGVCFHVKDPQNISDYATKVFFAYGLKNLIDLHRDEIGPEEFSLMEDTFIHGLGLGNPTSSEIIDLPPIVTLNSFMFRVSQSKFYLDGTFCFDCKDKYSGLDVEAIIGCLGIRFTRGTINLCVTWTKFEKISIKSAVVKMQVMADKANSIPTQYFLLQFPSPFIAKSFSRVCIESCIFYTGRRVPPILPIPDLTRYGYLVDDMMIEHVDVSYMNNSYNFELSGGFDYSLPLYVSHVGSDLSVRLPLGSAVIFINGTCTFSMSAKKIENIITCYSITNSQIRLGVIKDFLQITTDRVTITCRSEKIIENFEKLMKFTANNAQFVEKMVLLLPTLYLNLDDIRSDKLLKMSISQLMEDIKNSEIRRQYNSVPKVWPGMTIKTSLQPNFRYLNRYRDTVPYDQNLLTLAGGSRYINASPIGYDNHGINLKFIASQGPMDYTTADFYHLIWERRINIVVMVTGLRENGVEKCYKYWPDLNQTVSYSCFEVKTLYEQDYGVYLSSLLEITLKSEEGSLLVQHFRYVDWPDHGVPSGLTNFYDFILFLNNCLGSAGSTDWPLVHCSAGVGRTGVVMMSLIILRLIMNKCPVVPVKILEVMRQGRTLVVQTLDQFCFICKLAVHMYEMS